MSPAGSITPKRLSPTVSADSETPPVGGPSDYRPDHGYSEQDVQERMKHCHSVLNEILTVLYILIRCSPHSSYWAKLFGDEWVNENCFRPLILHWLTSLAAREKAPSGRAIRSQHHWDVATGIAQVHFYVAGGIPVLHRKMTAGELILQGNS